ncbi:MAG: HNH endonuclease [Flavobacteriales bacterium]|nr:HNH endonuclease [Flavobacteriales bacterium]
MKRSATNGGAPHKPILLLSILSLIRKGEIPFNRIEITPSLVLEFKSIWALLVVSQHTANFSLPFFHMRSEPFWRLVTKAGMIIPVTNSNSIKSLSSLKDSIAFAEIDKDLFDLLLDSVSSSILEDKLLEMYFPETKSNYRLNDYSFINNLETQILNDDRESYAERITELRESLSNDEFEEEIFVRSGVFKREIPKIYDYQCAISGMRVESTTNAQLVDACHIIPFAISKDDTITNGISLSPNLHRAFDRGLLTINADYVVRISPAIKENESPYSLKQFEGKLINLPIEPKFYPSIENLNWHRKECFVL